MRYITVDEYRIIGKAIEAVQNDSPGDLDVLEHAIGDTLDIVEIDGILTLKYSNVLLIGVKQK